MMKAGVAKPSQHPLYNIFQPQESRINPIQEKKPVKGGCCKHFATPAFNLQGPFKILFYILNPRPNQRRGRAAVGA